MSTFNALRCDTQDTSTTAAVSAISLHDIDAGEVVIAGEYSSINFKDALGVTGKGKILRKPTMTPGIDVAGKILSSEDTRWKAGQTVLVNGCGMGEVHDGGFSEQTRVPADWVVSMPEGLDPRTAMAYGTAGFTAGLAIHRMEHNGQKPEHGSILISGASGGVGSFAIAMLKKRGYHVTALTGRESQADYLKSLGADEVLLSSDLPEKARPLEKGTYGGAIDNLGGDVLAYMAATVNPWGNIASIGLAATHKLNTTVMPFILRGVSLLGIDSSGCPIELRQQVWNRLADDLGVDNINDIIHGEVTLEELPAACEAIMNREHSGRTLVKLSR